MYRTQTHIPWEKKSNKPEVFHTKHKWCETPRELACLRITRLIACNVVDKAFKLMKNYKIDINCSLEEEGPHFYFFIEKANTFIGIALIYSSFNTIKKLIKAGADPFINYGQSEPLLDMAKAFIPQITALCKVKHNKSLMYDLGVKCYNGLFDERLKGERNRYSLINKFIFTKPICCNAYRTTKKEKLEMLYKNMGPSRRILEPDIERFKQLQNKGKLEYDRFFGNFMVDFRHKHETL